MALLGETSTTIARSTAAAARIEIRRVIAHSPVMISACLRYKQNLPVNSFYQYHLHKEGCWFNFAGVARKIEPTFLTY
jgi:hypothetical protein